MERGTLMKTFQGNNQTPKSPPNLRDGDASFSSYLRPDDDKPINCKPHHTIVPGLCRALADSTSELNIFDAHRYFNGDIQKVNISSSNRVSPLVNMADIEHNPERGDIRETSTSRYSSASFSVDGSYTNIRNRRAYSFHASTPTIASSETRWNSPAGLLSHHRPAAISVSVRNTPQFSDLKKKMRASLSKPIWLLRRYCPCSCKRSVQVKEQTPEPKTLMLPTLLSVSPPPQHLSHNQITRDSLNPKRQDLGVLESNAKTPTNKFTMDMEETAAKTHKIPIITRNNCVDQRPKDQNQAMLVPISQSFQPAVNQNTAISQPQRVVATVRPFADDSFTFPVLTPHSGTTSHMIKLQVVKRVDEEEEEPTSVSQKPTDSDLQTFSFPQITKSRTIDDDAASDASSDLFEIESFSTQTTPPYPVINRIRDSIDEANTAEGYERASGANFFARDTVVHGGAGDHQPEKWTRKGSSGNGLLACRSETAVKCVAAAEEGHAGVTGAVTGFNVKAWKQ